MEIVDQNKKDLPNSTAVLVLGILSLVFCWCYGIVGLVLGIIAVALSGSPRRVYAADPEAYSEASYKNLSAGRICGIIGICLAILVFLFFILLFMGIIAAGIASSGF